MPNAPIPIDANAITSEEAEWFWQQVKVGPPGSCWPYVGKGSRDKSGYVKVRFQGKSLLAHRIAYVLSGRPLTDEIVMHGCDWPSCVSPRCLSAGTVAENNRQRDERGRRTPFLPRGAASPSAKLTEREVSAIRTAREQGVKAAALAAMFGVSKSTISNVQRGVYYQERPATSAA